MGLQRCVYITVGISGAGKSTWIKKTSSLLKDNQFLVISPDMERKMLTGDISNQECSGVAFFNCFKQLEKAVNNKDLFHYSYQRYIDNQIREVFGLEGTPTRYIVRERGDDKD